MNIPEPLWGFIGAVAVALGGSVVSLYRGTHIRIAAIEKRIETLELEINKEFLSKEDFKDAMKSIEAHMIRIENKLDRIQ